MTAAGGKVPLGTSLVSRLLRQNPTKARKMQITVDSLKESDPNNSGDSFIFTTLSGMGADIQTLWEDSKAVSPPMHLNFIN